MVENIHEHWDCMYETIIVHVDEILRMDMRKRVCMQGHGPVISIIAGWRNLFDRPVTPTAVGATAISKVFADGGSGELSIANRIAPSIPWCRLLLAHDQELFLGIGILTLNGVISVVAGRIINWRAESIETY